MGSESISRGSIKENAVRTELLLDVPNEDRHRNCHKCSHYGTIARLKRKLPLALPTFCPPFASMIFNAASSYREREREKIRSK